MTEWAECALVFSMVGNELNTRAIAKTEALLLNIEQLKASAVAFARERGTTIWDGTSDLALEAIDFTDILENSFGLTFGVANNADYTVNVEFKDGKPCEVWGAD